MGIYHSAHARPDQDGAGGQHRREHPAEQDTRGPGDPAEVPAPRPERVLIRPYVLVPRR